MLQNNKTFASQAGQNNIHTFVSHDMSARTGNQVLNTCMDLNSWAEARMPGAGCRLFLLGLSDICNLLRFEIMAADHLHTILRIQLGTWGRN